MDLSRLRGFKSFDQGTIIQVKSKNFRPRGSEDELRFAHAEGRDDRGDDEVVAVADGGVEVGLANIIITLPG